MNPHLNQERVEYLQNRPQDQSERLAAWPRNNKNLPVCEIEIDWLRFSIRNHRTKAEQLKRIKETGNAGLFRDNPLGPLAQREQYELLKKLPRFPNLKEDLRNREQQDRAVVTAEGVVINGNRRLAALRALLEDDHLPARYMHCIILPEDATEDEMRLLETELQVAETFREEYSWINRLLLVDELLEANDQRYSLVATIMHMEERDVREDIQILRQLDQIVEMSDDTYLHADFEPHESAFKELTKHISNKPEDEAKAVRTAYFLGTLSKCNYRDLRHLRSPSALEYIEAEIKAMPELEEVADTVSRRTQESERSAVDDLLDDALGTEQSSTKAEALLSELARADVSSSIELPDGEDIAVTAVLSHLNIAVTQAAQEAKSDSEEQEKAAAPAKRIAEASAKIRRALLILPEARALPDWNEDEFRKCVKDLQNATKKLVE